MNAVQAINAVRRGQLVDCTKDEYQSRIRTALQDQAGKWIDEKQDIYATIALNEVQRLDKEFA